MKMEDKREYMGSNGDIVKVVGIVQHLGEVRGQQTICLASMKVYKKDGSVEYCDHTWIQNPTNLKLEHKFVGKIVKLEGELHSYTKYDRNRNKHVEKMGITMRKML